MRLVSPSAVLLAALAVSIPQIVAAQGYIETDLVSDISGRAALTDPNLANPWGVVPGPSGVFWVSNNVTNTSTLYLPDGTINPLVVSVPGGPTGIVLSEAGDSTFVFPSGDSTARAVFIFATASGTIAAWNPVTPNTTTPVVTTPDAAYLGLALANTPSGPRLYAADFEGGTVDVFNRNFLPVSLPASAFTDPTLPAGYAPFNVATINGQIYVAYALKESGGDEEVEGPGLGLINVYDTSGLLIRRFTEFGALNAPWAMVMAPAGFGELAGLLLVGNLGDGRINAFDNNGSLVNNAHKPNGDPIVLEGLWGLSFGRAGSAPNAENRLYFAAGIEDEAHGLFGYLSPAAVADTDTVVVACDNDARGVGFWRHLCGGPIHGNGHGNGNGNGHGNGIGNGNGNGNGKGKGHDGIPPGKGVGRGVTPDSLDTLFGCITADGGAFGSGGCFTAGCDLLQRVGRRSGRERAAQTLLTLKLNLCSGFLCDSLVLDCTTSAGSLTVGDLVDSLDAALCGGSDGDVRRFARLAGCVLDDDDDDGDDDGDKDVVAAPSNPSELKVLSRGANPMRLASGGSARLVLTTSAPSMVQVKIVDAAGRLVAQPLKATMVSGALEVNWDGRDLRGALVAPGNYFFRASNDKSFASGRIVVVR